MKKLPRTKNVIVLRTDYSNEEVWRSICSSIGKVEIISGSHVDYIEDVAYDNLSKEQILSCLDAYDQPCIILVDKVAMTQSDHPVLVVDLFHELGRDFRAIPSEVCSIENNLSLANMDFDEFAESAMEQGGVFKGFASTGAN